MLSACSVRCACSRVYLAAAAGIPAPPPKLLASLPATPARDNKKTRNHPAAFTACHPPQRRRAEQIASQRCHHVPGWCAANIRGLSLLQE
uniref:Secreted protein n=1 Tax=Macrostomum lignano TaxID=282301 RepID=A0A1I8JPQ4_9PLAT